MGARNQIATLKEVREDLAILNDWKDLGTDKLVVREYTVKKALPVRDGIVGPLQEGYAPFKAGSNAKPLDIYSGGQQQYEFIEHLGAEKWKNYLTNPIEHSLK